MQFATWAEFKMLFSERKGPWPVPSPTALNFMVYHYEIFAIYLHELSSQLTVSILKLKIPLRKNLHGDFKYQDEDLESVSIFNMRAEQNNGVIYIYIHTQYFGDQMDFCP